MKKIFLIISVFGFFVAANAQEKTEEVQNAKTLNSLNVQKNKTVKQSKAEQLKAIPVRKISKSNVSNLNSDVKSERLNATKEEKKETQAIEQKETSTK